MNHIYRELSGPRWLSTFLEKALRYFQASTNSSIEEKIRKYFCSSFKSSNLSIKYNM